MLPNKDKVADELVRWHFDVEPGTVEVYRIISPEEASPKEPIKLLEVNENTLETGRVDAFIFGPTVDTPYSTITAMVTGNEMQLIKAGQIELPTGWDLSKAKTYTREEQLSASK